MRDGEVEAVEYLLTPYFSFACGASLGGLLVLCYVWSSRHDGKLYMLDVRFSQH